MGASLNFISPEIEGFEGDIRVKVKDFRVVEIPAYEPSGEGEHVYLTITRVGKTTREVVRDLTYHFGVNKNDIGYAGLKDKNAKVTQTFSLPLGSYTEEEILEKVKKLGEIYSIDEISRHGNKIKTGHLVGNKFEIVIRNINEDIESVTKKIESVMGIISEEGVPNYFGPQRFGMRGDNHEIGKEILEGETEVREKWKKRLYVSAFQSYICNLYISKRIELGLFETVVLGDIAKKHDTGGMFEVEDLEEEQKRARGGEISFTSPMFGRKMKTTSEKAREVEVELLEELGESEELFVKNKVLGTRRIGRIFPEFDSIDKVEDELGEGLKIVFTIPKGSFATSVLREFFKRDVR